MELVRDYKDDDGNLVLFKKPIYTTVAPLPEISNSISTTNNPAISAGNIGMISIPDLSGLGDLSGLINIPAIDSALNIIPKTIVAQPVENTVLSQSSGSAGIFSIPDLSGLGDLSGLINIPKIDSNLNVIYPETEEIQSVIQPVAVPPKSPTEETTLSETEKVYTAIINAVSKTMSESATVETKVETNYSKWLVYVGIAIAILIAFKLFK